MLTMTRVESPLRNSIHSTQNLNIPQSLSDITDCLVIDIPTKVNIMHMLKRQMFSASDCKMLLINKINMLLVGLIVIVNLIVNITPGGEMGG